MDKTKLHKEALDNFQLVFEDEREQRRLANEEAIFLAAEDGQWSEDAKDKRRNRPMYTVDRISPVKDQITGNQRQTRTGIKVYPQKDGDKKTAEVYTGLIRSIEQQSSANEAYDNAFDEGSEGGYGGWRILYDFVGDTFDREISIDPIFSAATSLYFDPAADRYIPKKAKWAYLISYTSPKQFKKDYPNAITQDFPVQQFKTEWFTQERIRLAEYWYKEPYKKKIGLMSDGSVLDLDEEKDVLDELAAEGVTLVRERKVDSHKVYMCVMNGAEILEGPTLWAGKYIPLIPYYGKRRIIDGKKYNWGIVRKAKDAQRIANYTISNTVETTALTPKDPIFYTPNMVKDHKQDWKMFNTRNIPFLGFTPDTLVPSGPFRLGAPAVQTALIQQTQQAIEDVRAATGFDSAMGQRSAEIRSGKALIAQEQQGDRGSFSYQDNLEKSKKYTGEQLVDLIQKVMDTEQIVQIIGPNENMEEVEINKTIMDEQTGKEVIVNDLQSGKYGVLVSSGPAAATRRKETSEQIAEFIGTDPEMRLLAGDIWIGNMDLNEGDELKKRFRKQQIDKGMVEATDDEKKEYGLDQQQPDPMNDALIRNVEQQSITEEMQQAKLASEVEKNEAATQKLIIESNKTTVDALKALTEALKNKLELNVPLDQDDAHTADGIQAMIDQTTQEVMENEEVAGTLPIGGQEQMEQPMPQQEVPAQDGSFENRQTTITPRPPSLAEVSK